MNSFRKTLFTERFDIESPKPAGEIMSRLEVLLSQPKGFNFSVASVERQAASATYVLVPKKQCVAIRGGGDRAIVRLKVQIGPSQKGSRVVLHIAANKRLVMFSVLAPMAIILVALFAPNAFGSNADVLAALLFFIIPIAEVWLIYNAKRDFLGHFCQKMELMQ